MIFNVLGYLKLEAVYQQFFYQDLGLSARNLLFLNFFPTVFWH